MATTSTEPEDENRVALTVGGRVFVAWRSVRTTAGLETFPRASRLETSMGANNRAALSEIEGKARAIEIGPDAVVTGFVERVASVISADRHAVGITDRGKGCDPIACSAPFDAVRITDAPLELPAEKYTKPYGIEVVDEAQEARVIPTPAVSIGMTPYDIPELAARHLKPVIREDGRGGRCWPKACPAAVDRRCRVVSNSAPT